MGNQIAKKRSMGRQTFIHGAMILTVGMVIVKAVGALFKIPLTGILTANGLGYFNNAYTFYGVIFSLATAGFPVAIAKMVAENASLGLYNDVKQVKRVALPLFLITGTLGTVIMFVGAPLYVKGMNNQGALLPMLVLAPSIFFCCLSSIYRGYYEGIRNMYPTAISEIIESLCKLIIGLSAALFTVYFCNAEFVANGTVFGVIMEEGEAAFSTYSYAAAAAILGVTIGSLFSWLYLLIYYKVRGDGITAEMYRSSPKPHSGRSIAKKLILIAIPIAIGSIAMSVSGLIDMMVLYDRLGGVMEHSPEVILNMYRGMIPIENLEKPSSIPNFLFGCYTAGLTIFMLVPSITQAFGISALPSLTDSWARQNKVEIKTNMESILRITCLFAIPAGLGITALAEPIASLLYGAKGSTQIVARILIILGIGAIFSAVSTPISSMLQAVGRVDLPVKIIIGALAVKILVNFALCGIPEINVLGAGTGTLVCYLLVTVLELIALVKITHVKINYKSTFVKPFFCALLCAAGAFGTSNLAIYFGLGMKLACVAGIAVAVLIYVISLLVSKTITKTDVIMLPKGEKIAKLLEKHGWIG